SCFAGFEPCTKGTCTDLSEATSCGTCNTRCSDPTPFCAPTSAGPFPFVCSATCLSFLNACGTKQCFDLTKSVSHCGTCDKDCRGGRGDPPGGQWKCKSSQCQLECGAGFHLCSVGNV